MRNASNRDLRSRNATNGLRDVERSGVRAHFDRPDGRAAAAAQRGGQNHGQVFPRSATKPDFRLFSTRWTLVCAPWLGATCVGSQFLSFATTTRGFYVLQQTHTRKKSRHVIGLQVREVHRGSGARRRGTDRKNRRLQAAGLGAQDAYRRHQSGRAPARAGAGRADDCTVTVDGRVAARQTRDADGVAHTHT